MKGWSGNFFSFALVLVTTPSLAGSLFDPVSSMRTDDLKATELASLLKRDPFEDVEPKISEYAKCSVVKNNLDEPLPALNVKLNELRDAFIVAARNLPDTVTGESYMQAFMLYRSRVEGYVNGVVASSKRDETEVWTALAQKCLE